MVTEQDDVAAEREFLERSLADLERERAAGDLTPEDHRLLRDRYEAKLAALGARSGGEIRPPAAGSLHQNGGGWGRRVGIGAVVVALAVGAGVLVARASGTRAPGETITGDVPGVGEDAASAGEDVDPRLEHASRLFADGQPAEALALYDEILRDDPENVVALTYSGWTLVQAGRGVGDDEIVDRGIAQIEEATRADATYPDAWFFLGIAYFRYLEDPERGEQALRLALANDPPEAIAGAARQLLGEITQAGR